MEERMLRFTSRFLGREAEYALFLPKGEGPFKTLYLLHGYGGNARQWKEKSAVARLAAAHRLAVVMPGCGDGYYQDNPAAGVYTASTVSASDTRHWTMPKEKGANSRVSAVYRPAMTPVRVRKRIFSLALL